MVDHLHAKAVRTPFCDALADAAHADDAQGSAVNVGTGKHVVAPMGPEARAQKMFGFNQAPRRGHQQGKAEICRGLGQHIGRIGGQHTGRCHGGHVKVVVAHGHVGANLQVRAACQQLGINALGTGGEHALLALQTVDQLGFGPDCV